MKKNLSTLKSNQMNNLLTHYPVNWIDGMKLSSSHFIAVQDFVTDSVRDAIALQTIDLNYGLQPVVGDSVKIIVLGVGNGLL